MCKYNPTKPPNTFNIFPYILMLGSHFDALQGDKVHSFELGRDTA